MNPKLIIEQKITVLVNKYSIYQANPDGSKAGLLAMAQQKRIAFKEKVSFYADEEQTQLAFTLRAEKVMDVHGRYFVEDPNGQLIGIFRKDFKKSLFSSTWHIVDSQDVPAVTLGESNRALAIARRFVGLIPFVGEYADLLVGFLKYHFVFRDAEGTEVGRYQKTTLFRDHYTLSYDDQAYQTQDWRVLAAVSVALDALQSR